MLELCAVLRDGRVSLPRAAPFHKYSNRNQLEILTLVSGGAFGKGAFGRGTMALPPNPQGLLLSSPAPRSVARDLL
jgi:hypothetical protein